MVNKITGRSQKFLICYLKCMHCNLHGTCFFMWITNEFTCMILPLQALKIFRHMQLIYATSVEWSQARKVRNHCLRVQKEHCIWVVLYFLFLCILHILSSIIISSSSDQLLLQSWSRDEGLNINISLTGQGRWGLIDRHTSNPIKVRGPGWLLPGVSHLL